MSRGIIILIALLVACLLAAPAAAGIQRYTDSQGVIRITNNGPAKPKQIRAETPEAAPGAPNNPRDVAAKSEAVPPPAAPAQPIPGEQVNPAAPEEKQITREQFSTPAGPGNSLPVVPPEPRIDSGVPSAPENPESASPPAAVTAPGPLPVQQVAFDPDAPGTVPIPAVQAAPQPKPENTRGDGIRRFRDRQGVLVITNVAPGREDAAAPMAVAGNSSAPGRSVPEEQPYRSGPVPGAPNLLPASWSPEQPGVAPLATAAASARITAPIPGGTIRRYRDKDGVIHIENVVPGAGESPSPPTVVARAGPVEETGPPVPPRSPPADETGPPAVVKPVAQSPVEEGKPPGLWMQTAAFMQTEIGPPGALSRQRDRLGIWHIKNVKDPWILEASPLPRPVAGPREVLLAAVNLAARLPEVNMVPPIEVRRLPQITELPEFAWAPGPAVPTEPASSRNYAGITAVRDSRGRLVITNAPPRVGIGSGPSWALASAQLEPIIQEAAQAYRLPPSLIRAVIKVESNFFHLAVSPKGAMGLMQLMPGTAQFLGVQEPFNPRENVHGGCRYLRMLIDSFGGSLPLALAAYNAGPQRVVASGYRVPAITETQDFLTQVIGRYLMEEKKTRSPWT